MEKAKIDGVSEAERHAQRTEDLKEEVAALKVSLKRKQKLVLETETEKNILLAQQHDKERDLEEVNQNLEEEHTKV